MQKSNQKQMMRRRSEKTGIHWDPLGSAGTPAGHPGAMFVHDPWIRPIDLTPLLAVQTHRRPDKQSRLLIDCSGLGRLQTVSRHGPGAPGANVEGRVFCDVSRLASVDADVMCSQVNNSTWLQQWVVCSSCLSPLKSTLQRVVYAGQIKESTYSPHSLLINNV